MYVVAHGSGKSGFLPQPVVRSAAAADKGPTVGPASSLQLPSPGQCVQRSHHSGRGSRPKKGVLGAKKGERAGRTATGGRSVRLGGLQLVPSAGAEARKSH